MRRQPGWISRDERDQVLLDGSARLADGRVVEIKITDLSREGCRVQSDETLKIGEQVHLSAEAIQDVAAIVHWELCGTAGLRFTGGDWT